MIAVIAFWTCLLVSVEGFDARPYALVNPVAGTSHLKVAEEGIALLNSIDGPVSPVVVIGPYRSGKSFSLNQLLGVPCNVGFGVGHTRETETKGIWVWGQPQASEGGGKTVSHASICVGHVNSALP
eukprot:GHRQ01024280.1.p1 GENE.GHRQ01024280.1~~GHRQ01024280.1.p1  ORF type:complete len:126 (+),score=12.72 GHRQ01024280.1:293-670(+)